MVMTYDSSQTNLVGSNSATYVHDMVYGTNGGNKSYLKLLILDAINSMVMINAVNGRCLGCVCLGPAKLALNLI